jgi:NTP pyrophosphatase (non-canonical NTP hydrolase)
MKEFKFYTETAATEAYSTIMYYMTTHHYITLGQVCTLVGKSYTPEDSQVGWRSTNGITIIYNACQNVYKLILPDPEPLSTGGVVEMTMNEYQELAMRTCSIPYENKNERLYHAVFGLNSEAGEVAGILQKEYQGHEIDPEHLKKELGDCLWMIAEACDALDISMSEVAQMNIDKLKARYPEGFEVERSLNRAEGDV